MGELGRRQIRASLDIVSILWIVVAFFEFVYLAGYVDLSLEIAVKGLIGGVILIGGLVLCSVPQLGVGLVLDLIMSADELIEWVTSVFISFILILIMNTSVSRFSSRTLSTLAFAPIAITVFTMLIGISEEVALRGYLLNLLSNLTGLDSFAIIVSAAIGATIHAGVYGARSITVIFVVFICFIGLGWIYATSTQAIKGPFTKEPVLARRLSIVMTAHALVNFLSMWRGGYG